MEKTDILLQDLSGLPDGNTDTAGGTDEELGVLSMQRIAMCASIENEYDVMIPVAKFGQFGTIGELVDFVMEEA